MLEWILQQSFKSVHDNDELEPIEKIQFLQNK